MAIVAATAEPARRRGGRPSRQRAALIARDIVEVATQCFLDDGYGATSIETVSRRARVAKRTLYSRFPDKPALFLAVVRHVLDHLRPASLDELFRPGPLSDSLPRVARTIIGAAMDPLALGLYRVTVAEAARFPEIAGIMAMEGGGREAIGRIAELLDSQATVKLPPAVSQFAAAQFLHMLIDVPQQRGLGLGPPMTEGEQELWAEQTVRLFLDGWRGTAQG